MFLAELYLPETGAKTRRAVIAKAERAAASLTQDGAQTRLVPSVAVPRDEMCFLLFEADSLETVGRVGDLGGLRFDRVVEAVSS